MNHSQKFHELTYYFTSVLCKCLIIISLTGLSLTAQAQDKKSNEKIRIAVASFTTSNRIFAPDILYTSVTNSMVNIGRYEVVAREQLDKVLAEQRLNNSDLVDPQTAQSVGKLLGAKYIIVGQIIEGSFKPGYLSKDQFSTKAQLQLIDVATGGIKISETFTATISKFLMESEQNSNGARRLSDQESQKRYADCTESISRQFCDRVNLLTPLEGYIVAVEGMRVAINLGLISGVKPGQEFLVYRDGKQIKDPISGEILSSEKKSVARLVVKQVEAKLSWAEIIVTYSTSANIHIGNEIVDLYPINGSIEQLMSIVQTDTQAELLSKELEKVRKKQPKK